MKKMMGTAIIAATFIVGSGVASACEMAGKDKHIGSIVSVNLNAKTFTIKDAATNKNISFNASKQLLMAMTTDKHVKVTYKEAVNGRLTTVALKYI